MSLTHIHTQPVAGSQWRSLKMTRVGFGRHLESTRNLKNLPEPGRRLVSTRRNPSWICAPGRDLPWLQFCPWESKPGCQHLAWCVAGLRGGKQVEGFYHKRELKAWKERKVAQSCPTLRLPGSYIHGIFQARVLEWVAISFSRGSSRLRDRAQVSRIADRRFTIWATRQAWSKHIFRRSETESKSLAVPMESISLLKSLSYDLRVWLLLQIQRKWDVPGGPVAKTRHSQCRGPKYNTWSGN